MYYNVCINVYCKCGGDSEVGDVGDGRCVGRCGDMEREMWGVGNGEGGVGV